MLLLLLLFKVLLLIGLLFIREEEVIAAAVVGRGIKSFCGSVLLWGTREICRSSLAEKVPNGETGEIERGEDNGVENGEFELLLLLLLVIVLFVVDKFVEVSVSG